MNTPKSSILKLRGIQIYQKESYFYPPPSPEKWEILKGLLKQIETNNLKISPKPNLDLWIFTWPPFIIFDNTGY